MCTINVTVPAWLRIFWKELLWAASKCNYVSSFFRSPYLMEQIMSLLKRPENNLDTDYLSLNWEWLVKDYIQV